MSYTRPDADAVNFAFTGAAYTRPAANAVNFAFGEDDPPPDPDPVLLKAWSGSAWVTATAKRWDGSTWAAATVKRFDGGAWQGS